MRKRIKPIVVYFVLGLLSLTLVLAQAHQAKVRQKTLATAQQTIPEPTTTVSTTTSNEEEDETLVLNPIIDISGWQLPSQINYDTLSKNISGAIVRVFGGSQITKDNNAAHTTGVDKSFKTHIKEFQKRNIPVAVYSYALGTSEKEMREEAQLFYKNASPYNPTFYWIDVEEVTMTDMDAGVQAFREELKKLGAEKVGIYIGTYFMQEQAITVDQFDAVWFPTYGSNSGYYEAAPETDLEYHLHQYTSEGSLPGFDGSLDLNQIAVTQKTKSTYEYLFGEIKE
ncbi:glycoside hydrolase family 25 protein [Streptococcus caprae]|uniref:Glycoside hydrolase family 25 protein n=1 Tax=Streptococcus caprae TaxID=1640501 RepID=A0ABV8CWG9_9STRE